MKLEKWTWKFYTIAFFIRHLNVKIEHIDTLQNFPLQLRTFLVYVFILFFIGGEVIFYFITCANDVINPCVFVVLSNYNILTLKRCLYSCIPPVMLTLWRITFQYLPKLIWRKMSKITCTFTLVIIKSLFRCLCEQIWKHNS